MAAYSVLMQQVDDVDRYRFSITSQGEAVVAPEFTPAGRVTAFLAAR